MFAFHRNKSGRIGNFLRNDRGTIALMFSLTLVPLIVSVGMAVDYARALSVKTVLQSAVDAAALAGASRNAKDETGNGGRQTIALEILRANSSDLADVNGLQKTVNFGQDSITVTASMDVKTTLGAFVIPSMAVSATASAKFGTSAPLCMLALNGAADDTFKAWGTADLVAPDCAVHSKSASPVGMVTGGSATATAKQFCSAGGHSGSAFSPEVEDNCTPAADPYAGRFDSENLAPTGVFDPVTGNMIDPVTGLIIDPTSSIDLAVTCTTTNSLRIRTDVTYDAGSLNSVMAFCGGIIVQAGATLTFAPGVYKIYGQFKISSGGAVVANGATLYFGDPSSGLGSADGYLNVIGGGHLDLKAPTTGPMAGIAMVQPTVSTYTGGTTAALTHTIIGGGTVNIVGVIYTPKAKVRVTGNGTINDTSPYFSIIADFVELEGNGQLYINAGADTTVSGLPSMPLAGGYGGTLLN